MFIYVCICIHLEIIYLHISYIWNSFKILAFEPFEQGWLIKTVGETQQFNLVGKEEGVTSYAVVVLKNLRWPGNYTVANVNSSPF